MNIGMHGLVITQFDKSIVEEVHLNSLDDDNRNQM